MSLFNIDILNLFIIEAPNYLLNLIPKSQQTITTKSNRIPNYHCRVNCFKYSFFPSILKDWFNLNASIRHSEAVFINASTSPIFFAIF